MAMPTTQRFGRNGVAGVFSVVCIARCDRKRCASATLGCVIFIFLFARKFAVSGGRWHECVDQYVKGSILIIDCVQ